jgi:Berberine and berberine like
MSGLSSKLVIPNSAFAREAALILREHSTDLRVPACDLKRLAQVKRRYDPDNLFHLNLNVVPDNERREAA